MDTRTGEIKILTDEQIVNMPLKERLFHVELTDKEAETLEGMNRERRRRWYRNSKKKFVPLTVNKKTKEGRYEAA